MRKNGYETVLFFLGTQDVEINKALVQARVREGGHDDEPRKIAQLQNGRIIYLDPHFPAWVKDSLQIAEKLKRNTH